jgi:hypothetical protein
MKLIYVFSTLLLAGCASTTGVVPIGQNTFMIAREDNSPAASLGALKAAAFKEAGAFCAGQDRTMQVTKESDTPRSLGQFPQTTLQFKCI